MAIMVRGRDTWTFDEDHVMNSVLIHEYCHMLQFCTTGAGLSYQASSTEASQQLLKMLRELRSIHGGERLPRTVAATVSRAATEPSLTETLRAYAGEKRFMELSMGWPASQFSAGTTAVGILDGDEKTEVLPIGLLLIAEGHARGQQLIYLDAIAPDGPTDMQAAVRIGVYDDAGRRAFRVYVALRQGFIDQFSGDDALGTYLFDYCCAKSLMTPGFQAQFVPSSEHDQLGELTSLGGEAKAMFPGARYRAVARALLDTSERGQLRTLIEEERIDELDARVSEKLNWQTWDRVASEFSEATSRLEPGLLKRLTSAAARLHAEHAFFLVRPVYRIRELAETLPAFQWIVSDGSVWATDWLTPAERHELAEVAVTALLTTALNEGQAFPCPYFGCCMEHDASEDQLGRPHPVDCPLDLMLRRVSDLSLSDFADLVPA